MAGAGSAFYNTYSKKLLEVFSELEVLIYGYIVGTCFCGALSIASGRPFYAPGNVEITGWISVAVLGAISWGLAMVLWMWALKRLAASQASVYRSICFPCLD